ncbi:MAG: hypothetical protein ABSH35_19375 [Isosphaeraceae bacterium]
MEDQIEIARRGRRRRAGRDLKADTAARPPALTSAGQDGHDTGQRGQSWHRVLAFPLDEVRRSSQILG